MLVLINAHSKLQQQRVGFSANSFFIIIMTTTQSLEGYIIDDRYTVCKRLQSGFYGATWLATDAKDDHKDVCLKVLDLAKISS